MSNENEELFNQIEEEEAPEAESPVSSEEEFESPKEFKPVVNSKSLKEIEDEKGIKEKKNGEVLTVKSVEIMPPKTYTLKDGIQVKVEPIISPNTGVKYFTSKLKVRFEEDNLVEYYPGINYFLDKSGNINPRVTLNRAGDNQISNLTRKILIKIGSDKGLTFETKKTKNGFTIADKDLKTFSEFSKTISDQTILDYLVGKKVKIETEEGVYMGKSWFRNDIAEIL